MTPETLAHAVAAQDRRALARAITLVESQRPDHRATLEAYNAASSSVTIAKSGYWPSLTGSASYGYSSSRIGDLVQAREALGNQLAGIQPLRQAA